jgi:hypothetical protein
LSLIRTSILPEHELSQHDLPEHDLPEHDLLEHDLLEHDLPEHDLPEHHHQQHGLPQPDPKPVKTAKFHLALSGAAVAIAAAVAGALGAGSVVGASHPAAISRPVPIAGQAHRSGTPLTVAPAFPAVLDAFFAAASIRSGERLSASGGAVTERASGVRLTPRHIARLLLHRFHWRRRQFHYLNLLWSRESSWNIHAFNAYSGAYGIPQAVPGSKMAAAGPHWQNSARTQILWGLRYIKQRYGSPEGAWRHELSVGWY